MDNTKNYWELREVIKCGNWNRSGGYEGTTGLVDQLLMNIDNKKNQHILENRVEGEFSEVFPDDCSGIRSPGMMGWGGRYYPFLELMTYMISNKGMLILSGCFGGNRRHITDYLESFRDIERFQADIIHYKNLTVCLIDTGQSGIVKISGENYGVVLNELLDKYKEAKEAFYRRLYPQNWQEKLSFQDLKVHK